jgi:hypothetical protein
VAHQTLTTFIIQKIRVQRNELRYLGAHGRRQKLLRTLSQKIRQRVR